MAAADTTPVGFSIALYTNRPRFTDRLTPPNGTHFVISSPPSDGPVSAGAIRFIVVPHPIIAARLQTSSTRSASISHPICWSGNPTVSSFLAHTPRATAPPAVPPPAPPAVAARTYF